MKKLNPSNFITHKEFKKELMKNPAFRKAHEANRLEFQILDAIISTRIKEKLTQKKLAKKIGVTQSALARFESGRVNPTLSFVQKVVMGLGLKLVVK